MSRLFGYASCKLRFGTFLGQDNLIRLEREEAPLWKAGTDAANRCRRGAEFISSGDLPLQIGDVCRY